ncbi:TonB-dependent receptor [Teredinibacter haidensis]|uniref:TonB-dependent receptor n=1 Tax=Cellvibrionaceae bacterium Bs08 TaxID=1500539 RepID=A0A0D3MF96_9GAMM|nr:TonB-dependent receptor [Teredinibacter haidensis]AIH07654.1 TonB-dependent receptor [Cellvibrionaceae bacterium Bs08]
MTKPSGVIFRKKAIALAVSCALSSAQLYAQEDAADDADFFLEEEVIVTGVRASQAKAIDLKRDNVNVVDSIVAEDIGKLPDTTITDSLQRVTGVQITREAGEGTSLNIRGMPQVLTMLNGEQFLSPMSITGVGANYSDVPANMISGVDVYKSQSASTLAGGISGVVDLKTLNPSDLEAGFTGRLRVEGGMGSRSMDVAQSDGSTDTRDPDYSVAAIAGYDNDDNFAVVASLYTSDSYAANYSMYEQTNLAFIDEDTRVPGDPLDLDGDGDLLNDWYLVPSQYGASSSFVDRARVGGSVSAKYYFNENWSVRGDVFYTEMDKYDRGVRAGFNAAETPDAQSVNGENALTATELYDTLQAGSIVGPGAPITYVDSNGDTQTRELHTLLVADVWAADFQTTSYNQVEKTAAINSNIELNYTNNDNIEASVRAIHGEAERQYRNATFQQGTPAWLWVDEDDIDGKDPVAGYHVTVDYRGEYPEFIYSDDLSDANLLKQYQGFADGENTEATLSALRGDIKFSFEHDIIDSVEGGVRYGVRTADHNRFFYVAPTGRYTDWEDPRVPADKRYQLLPGNLAWQQYPNWLKFNFEETNSSLIDVGGLEDNGFSAADTMPFTDFGPIKGFEAGVASLDPAAWDNPYEFMNRLYPGARTVNDPGYTYSVEEASVSVYGQLNFGNESDGLFGIPYSGNVGLQVVQTDRKVDKSVVPTVLDSFNSIGYDDWQKIAYVYTTERHENSSQEILPSFNLNLFPTDDLVLRFGASKAMTRNDLQNVGSSMSVWLSRCPKTDANGDAVMVLNPTTGQEVQDDVGCVGGGDDRGQPDIEPWTATVFNSSAEWYFAENAILGLGLFMIQVDTAVEDYQEPRHFADMDGIDRNNLANIWTTRNVGASDLMGIEFGYKQPFSFIPVEFLNSTGVEFNYTYSKSESGVEDIEGDEFPLVSNSAHQSNLILWYDRAGLNLRLAYNWRSEEYLGRVGVNSNETVMNLGNWLEPAGYLDFSASYDVVSDVGILDNLNVFFNATNLTEESRKSYAQFEDQYHSLWVQETRYTAGVNISF